MGTPRVIRIEAPSLARTATGLRVTAEVDGTPVWFESPDLALESSPESFASLFLLPALAHGATLVSVTPLDGTWLANSRHLIDTFARWWRYPLLPPQSLPGSARSAIEAGAVRERGLFFSGGVDSFHSLLCCGESVQRLIFVQGFDIPLTDSPRAEVATTTCRAVAAELGIAAGFVSTNLREHPLVRAVPWERTNGGALASVGHLLAQTVEEVLVSSSISISSNEPWGSHPEVDRWFSSSRVRFRTVTETHRRMTKIQELAPQPLPRQHLRVCWQNRTATGNCSKCDKCVITRLVLAEAGVLEDFGTLEGVATLANDLDAIRSDKRFQTLDEMSQSPRLAPDIRRAARRLYERSVHTHSLPVRMRRALVRKWLEWTQPKPA